MNASRASVIWFMGIVSKASGETLFPTILTGCGDGRIGIVRVGDNPTRMRRRMKRNCAG